MTITREYRMATFPFLYNAIKNLVRNVMIHIEFYTMTWANIALASSQQCAHIAQIRFQSDPNNPSIVVVNYVICYNMEMEHWFWIQNISLLGLILKWRKLCKTCSVHKLLETKIKFNLLLFHRSNDNKVSAPSPPALAARCTNANSTRS